MPVFLYLSLTSFSMEPVKLSFFLSICVTTLTCVLVAAGDHCIWYGECGTSQVSGRPVNCYDHGQARPFQRPSSLELFRETCPDLYQGPQTRTCCGDDQMQTLYDNVDVARRLLGACPACLRNFLNVYCYATCHPRNSDFIYPKVLSAWVDPATHRRHQQILEVDYLLTPAFAQGMFNSCRQVPLPNDDSSLAIGVLCGHPAAECTAQNWLDYMGNVENQQTPFTIHFNITATPQNSPVGVLTPADAVIAPSPCSAPTYVAFPTVLTTVTSQTQYRQAQVIIERTGHHDNISHGFPPPSTSSVVLNPIFDQGFLHEVLNLQKQVEAVTGTRGGGNVSLPDVCLQSGGTSSGSGSGSMSGCLQLSLLSYFQDSAQTLDRVVMDDFGFYVLGDYIDHLLYCFKRPMSTNDTTPLHESCLDTFGRPVYPYDVLSGYDNPHGVVYQHLDDVTAGCCSLQGVGPKYETSTRLMVTWLLQPLQDSSGVVAWETAFGDFLRAYSSTQPNMTLTWSTGVATIGSQLINLIAGGHPLSS